MRYNSLAECAADLEKNGQLIRIKEEVDPNLEMAAIHWRIFKQGGPAILFENIKGSKFPALSNLYGTFERTDFLFRSTLPKVSKVVQLKADPTRFLKAPFKYLSAPFTAISALPRKIRTKAAVEYGETSIDQLPLIKCWPMDGGAFVTLPQVFTLPPKDKNIMKSNIGMYRIQLSGNEYAINKEIGLHYQLHRGIGVHHQEYNQSDEDFRVSIFIGGPPSHAFAAIMPLPEGLTETTFAGMLAGKRFKYKTVDGHVLSADADFVITGRVRKDEKMPEGPFGDHLGYYSLEHDFPVVDVDKVYHRKDAIWHFTAVGRPPAEDSSFGYLIHKIVKPLTGSEFPGIKDVNAVDEAGVHPLLLVVGSERYMPFREIRPEELLTQANHLLGKGQTSLAKFLIIANSNDKEGLSANDEKAFFAHILERIDWTRDLHFQTKTTIDTLDYSGDGWNTGSKVVIAACGDPIRTLGQDIPTIEDNELFSNPKLIAPGILALQVPAFDKETGYQQAEEIASRLEATDLKGFPLIVLCDDSTFMAEDYSNFLWAAFTRTNPSHDIHGVHAFVEHKHWGCKGSLVMDARIKPHHAPELVMDPEVEKAIERFFVKGASLEGY